MTAKPQASVSHARGIQGDARQGRLREIQHREHPFTDVHYEHGESEELALSAQRIRGAGIAAARAADIDAAHASEHETAEQCAQQIREQRLDREFQHW
jgi:hypothetical protein